jgi:hypothetical protein
MAKRTHIMPGKLIAAAEQQAQMPQDMIIRNIHLEGVNSFNSIVFQGSKMRELYETMDNVQAHCEGVKPDCFLVPVPASRLMMAALE